MLTKTNAALCLGLCGFLYAGPGMAHQVTSKTSLPPQSSADGSRLVDRIKSDVDFFTTAWAFGAPYIRDTGRPVIRSSTPDPFLNSGGGANGPVGFWEETTYFMFNDFDATGYPGLCQRAVLRVGTTFQQFGTVPSPSNPFYISAHAVTEDPETIDPLDPTGSGSFFDFKSNFIELVEEDVVAVTGEGVFEWDVTDLVNEWIANGDANFDYSLAMTGRSGLNPADSGSTGFFHGFFNSNEGPGLKARIVVEF
ncbi:MAG: hypothetical protein AAF726_13345 [Planctomycetota bacterium]